MISLGIDTSNYTTSVAWFDGETGENRGKLLPVPKGALGLRQSDALFSHVKQIPELMDQLFQTVKQGEVLAVAASTRPRAVEGSYMPCFLAGESLGRSLASALGVPFYPVSHQQGHIAAAAWSAGRPELMDQPHLAWHLSGGTTELLLVKPGGPFPHAEKIGGTDDLSAGQLIDRIGVLLGTPFPAGKRIDAWSMEETGEKPPKPFSVKVKDCTFSLSGMENKGKAMVEAGESRQTVARFVLDTIGMAVFRATEQALTRYSDLPVLFAGGVSASRRLRESLAPLKVQFASPAYGTDNAMGVAILACRAQQKGD